MCGYFVNVVPSTKPLCHYCVYSNLRSTRLTVRGARENGCSTHYFQAPATQAMYIPLGLLCDQYMQPQF